MSKQTNPEYTINALAALTGYDRRTVRAMVKPIGARKKFTLEEFCGALRQHYTRHLEDERERRARLQSDLLALDLLERTEALIPTKMGRFLLENILVAARQGFIQLSDRIAHDRNDRTLAPAIDTAVRDILGRLSEGQFTQVDGAPRNFNDDFTNFVNRLVNEDPSVKQFSEISERIFKERKAQNENDNSTAIGIRNETVIRREAGGSETSEEPGSEG